MTVRGQQEDRVTQMEETQSFRSQNSDDQRTLDQSKRVTSDGGTQISRETLQIPGPTEQHLLDLRPYWADEPSVPTLSEAPVSTVHPHTTDLLAMIPAANNASLGHNSLAHISDSDSWSPPAAVEVAADSPETGTADSTNETRLTTILVVDQIPGITPVSSKSQTALSGTSYSLPFVDINAPRTTRSMRKRPRPSD